MSRVFFFRVGVDEEVIEIYRAEVVEVGSYGIVHESLEGGGTLVRPKDITRYLNSPYSVQKAVFHSSSSLILICLYPLCRSSLV